MYRPQSDDPSPHRPSRQPRPAAALLEAAATLAARRSSAGGETAGADGKAAGVLTLLGIMFTVLARFGPGLKGVLHQGGPARDLRALLLRFATMSLCAVVQAFRTIVPRFCKAKEAELAFFGEIAGLSREEYFERVESMTMRVARSAIAVPTTTRPPRSASKVPAAPPLAAVVRDRRRLLAAAGRSPRAAEHLRMKPQPPTTTTTTTSPSPAGHLRWRTSRCRGAARRRFAAFTPMNDQPPAPTPRPVRRLGVSSLLLSTLLFFTPASPT